MILEFGESRGDGQASGYGGLGLEVLGGCGEEHVQGVWRVGMQARRRRRRIGGDLARSTFNVFGEWRKSMALLLEGAHSVQWAFGPPNLSAVIPTVGIYTASLYYRFTPKTAHFLQRDTAAAPNMLRKGFGLT